MTIAGGMPLPPAWRARLQDVVVAALSPLGAWDAWPYAAEPARTLHPFCSTKLARLSTAAKKQTRLATECGRQEIPETFVSSGAKTSWQPDILTKHGQAFLVLRTVDTSRLGRLPTWLADRPWAAPPIRASNQSRAYREEANWQ